MKRGILHILAGAAVLTGSFSSLMAAEIGLVNTKAKAYMAPMEEAKVALRVFEGEEFEVQKEVDGYYEIIVDNEVVYLEKEYMTLKQEEIIEEAAVENNAEIKQEAVPKTEETVSQPVKAEIKVSTGEKVVAYAKQFIGTPYISGGTNLKAGVDCSGFTQQVFKNFGINLQRTSRSQYASNGYAVKKSELKPGDLVFYGYSSVCHVAIYIGNGQIIHAPVPGKRVSIAPLWQRGDAPIVGYRRVIKS